MAMVDRLGKILEDVRIEAVPTPPPGVICRQMKPESVNASFKRQLGPVVAETHLHVSDAPQTADPAVQYVTGRNAGCLFKDWPRRRHANEVGGALAQHWRHRTLGE